MDNVAFRCGVQNFQRILRQREVIELFKIHIRNVSHGGQHARRQRNIRFIRAVKALVAQNNAPLRQKEHRFRLIRGAVFARD